MQDNTATSLDSAVARSAEQALERVAAARTAIGAVIFGQEKVVEEALVTLIAGGHGLLVGVPGLAKTKLVETLGTVLGLDARRVQFTPDLMPSDILGSEILEEGADRARSFRFVKGPIFAQLLMADEINRASPRTQSALLQAMQEYHVTVGERVVDAILDLVRSARPGETANDLTRHIAWGPGPRAAQALMLASRARALVDGRLAPSIDDIIALSEPVLKHRMALTFAARAEGETMSSVIARLAARLG